MEPTPPSTPGSAEDLFAEYVEQVELGDSVDFDHWAANFPQHRQELHRIHARWQAITVAFSSLASPANGIDEPLDSAALTGLMGRLGENPSRWSRYALGTEVGRGAMGRVVVAWDQELRRDVALKILRGDGADQRHRRRFVEEAQIAAQLDHPGIVPIHELGVDEDGRPFFAMRLVRGRDLGAVLELERRGAEGWSRTRVLHVLLRVCEAIAYAHHKGVVHRDLKPANIMVGHFGETYVMDWGLARVIGHRDPASTDTARIDTVRAEIAEEDDVSPLLTRTGDIVGTPAYMAPEQAHGDTATIDPAVDVYAIGAILYHLLKGSPPYRDDGRNPSADQVLAALRTVAPSRLPDSLPAELRAICEHAMAREPAARYPRVESLAEDLRAFLELRVVKAYATGRFVELRKWVARNRALAGLSVGLFVVLTIGAVVSSALWLLASAERERANSTAATLAVELDHSEFRNARMALQSEDGANAGEALWRHHLAGKMPRATQWSLCEFAERTPVLANRDIDGVQEVAFSRITGNAFSTGPDGRIHEFDTKTLAPLRTLERADCKFVSLAASPTSPWIVAGDATGGVTMIDLRTEVQRHWSFHQGQVEGIEVDHAGRGFASVDEHGNVFWIAEPTAQPVRLAAIDKRATALAFDPVDRRLAVGSDDGKVRLLQLDGTELMNLQLGSFQILSLSFAPHVPELWVASRSIYVVDPDARKLVRTISTRNGTCRDLLHDTDGSVIAGGWWRIDRLVDERPPRPLALEGCWHIDLEPTARLLLAKRSIGGLDLIDLGHRDRLQLGGKNGSVALAADGRTAVSLTRNELVRYDLASGEEQLRMSVPNSGWLVCDHDAHNAAIVRPGTKGLTVLDLEARKVRFELDGAEETPFNESAQYSPDGRELAIIVGNDRVQRVDAATGALIGEMTVPKQELIRVRYSPDGKKLAFVWRRSPVVRICDLATGKYEDQRFSFSTTSKSIAAFALDHDGTRVAAGNWSGTIHVRNLKTKAEQILQPHSGTTWSLQFSPTDPGLLICSTGDGGVTFWDLDAAEVCYQPRTLEAPIGQVQISDDGLTLACSTVSGCVALDLSYRERHVAGLLDQYLTRLRDSSPLPPGREAELRQWAANVMSRPWPRWR